MTRGMPESICCKPSCADGAKPWSLLESQGWNGRYASRPSTMFSGTLQVLEGVTANGGTYIAAMDRSAAANFVLRAQSEDQRKKLDKSIAQLEKSLGISDPAMRWTPDSQEFKVSKWPWWMCAGWHFRTRKAKGRSFWVCGQNVELKYGCLICRLKIGTETTSHGALIAGCFSWLVNKSTHYL